MPTISFTLSDAALAEVIDAFCTFYNYRATLADGTPNPETRAQFARRMLIQVMRQRVVYRRVQLAESGVDTSNPDIT